MKRLLLLITLAGLSLSSCMKDPDFDVLNDEYVVSTEYNPKINFNGYNGIYYMPDTVIYINGNNPNSQIQYWTNRPDDPKQAIATQILNKIKTHFESLGYQRTSNLSDALDGTADLSAAVIISQANNLTKDDLYYDPNWAQPAYWWSWWEGWRPHSYPWGVHKPFYRVSTVAITLIDLKDVTPSPGGSTKPTAIWDATGFGAILPDIEENMSLILNAIDKSFRQSQYLDIRPR